MSRKRHLFKVIQKTFRQISKQFLSTIKKQIIWLMRTISGTRRRRGSENAGFLLPTVAMVTLVVVLLTTAILFRSFERSKNASNVRVNQAAINAATPAIDRGRAKLNKLFQDGRLPRATPTDDVLYSTLNNNINEYTFGDETQLQLALNLTQQGQRTETTEKNKTLRTAWLYPVDTDNNGKFDSYTLYGIYFRNPPISAGVYEYARNPLEARTPPMSAANVSGDCGGGTSASLVGNTGWFKLNNKLKKAFFVYTATVPITTNTTPNTTNYEAYKGNKSFSALEYQQDRIQLPLVNNAVLYEDDIGLSPGPAFRLNGRIFTNSNFLTGSPGGGGVKLYQVSSKESCFYEAENAKIVIGGNLGASGFTDTSDLSPVTKIDLFKGEATDPGVVDFAKSTTPANNEANLIAYNSLAYVQRINRLVSAQIANTTNPDPAEVTNGIQQQKAKSNNPSKIYTTAEELAFRTQQLQLYFQKRTRRVPYKEVPSGSTQSVALGTYATTNPLQGAGDALRPVDTWMYPTDPTDGKTGTNYTGLTLSISSGKLIPGATEPVTLQKDPYNGKEQSLGDRVVIGNNLPQIWWDSTQSRFVGPDPQDTQSISAINWDLPTSSPINRTRRSRVEILADLGSTDRDKDWELAAAKVPSNIQDPVGGLRVVTGAGIYLPDTFTAASTSFTSAAKEIWSDLMPVTQSSAPTTKTIKPYWMYDYSSVGATNYSSIEYKWPEIVDPTKTPYLRMRATAVYHYKATSYSEQNPKPIACVSSFYVPTNTTTAKNLSTLPAWASDSTSSAAGGLSNNGIVYGPPTKTVSNYQALLTYQSQLKYPKGDPKLPITDTANAAYLTGRSIDDGLLAKALAETSNLTLSEQSTIDAAICSLQILDGSISPVTSAPPIDHGAIRETAFLDPRQVKAIQISSTTTDYDLDKKDRQPLEIRATVLDINLLRTKTIGGTSPAQEYLLPNSGIIYATRNDALPDLTSTATDPEAQKLESPVDYKLDPTRRPNAIRLVNGAQIWRELNYRDAEKGLVLATNLPVYIKGDFNKHTQEEFTTALSDDWSNFYSRTKATANPNFACRPNDTRLPNCTIGDKWRPASVLADSITLLSNNFRSGYRNEGDYDWNNSYNGSLPIPSNFSQFSQYNSFVPTAQWRDTTTGIPKDLVPDVTGDSTTTGFQGSSYLNNFVTPIALQIPPGSYLTEVCSATNQADCSDPTNTTAWTIQTACGGGGGNTFYNGQIVGKNGDPGNNRIKTGYIFDDPATFDQGHPKCFPANAPRRIAFVRNATTGALVTPLQVLGVDVPGKVGIFNLGSGTSTTGTTLLPPPNDAFMPWLKPVVVGGVITKFEPVLQINQPFATPATPDNTDSITAGKHNNWLQVATETTFNLIAAAGDTPARPTEDNGGLHNFVRFIENWNPTGTTTDAIKARISGSFIQLKRSAYATAPFNTSISNQTNSSNFQYPIQGNNGRTPFYLAPTRQWGYDVALLSQSPDLFAQKLVTIPDDLPNEYFREVGRDDTWVKTLLCAKKASDSSYAIDVDHTNCS